MEILEAYDLVGTLRGAAKLVGVDHKTVGHYVAEREAGGGEFTYFKRYGSQPRYACVEKHFRVLIGNLRAIYPSPSDGRNGPCSASKAANSSGLAGCAPECSRAFLSEGRLDSRAITNSSSLRASMTTKSPSRSPLTLIQSCCFMRTIVA